MSEVSTLSGADKEKLECALGLLTDLIERLPDTRLLADEAVQYDLSDDLWLVSQILGMPPDQRGLLVQAFLCAEGQMTVTPLKGGSLLLASEPCWDGESRVVSITSALKYQK